MSKTKFSNFNPECATNSKQIGQAENALVHHFWLFIEQQEGGDVPATQMKTAAVLGMHRHLAGVIGAEN